MSTVTPPSYFVYSSLSFYAPRHGGELPGRWFMNALVEAGQTPGAVRQALYRMEHDGELLARKCGREKWYRASPYARAEIEAGLAKIFGESEEPWDGRWSLVLSRFLPEERQHRERVRSVMQVEGFATIAPGVFVHPRSSPLKRLRNAAQELAVEHRITSFRGELAVEDDAPRLARSLWDVDDLALRYRRFLQRYSRLLRQGSIPSPRRAFHLRFALVFDFLGVAWSDPQLPATLLPRDWPGHRARDLTRVLYERFLSGAIAHADEIYDGSPRDEERE
ncbi:MAG TPA: PaaX family transcriptional regulator C-terminal domain-containing protein [Thermoanaerobaculia bacterium]|nr:PaaX family transcriptional regulator C-terminal domain-containing protein [Thermoanaerobaculia bacterium]